MKTMKFMKAHLIAICLIVIFFANGIAYSAVNPGHPWSQIDGFPGPCGAGQYVSGIGATLSCGTPAGGSGQWTVSGSNIYYNTGNVAIGTTPTAVKLQIDSTDQAVHGDSSSAFSTIQADNTSVSSALGNGVYGTTTSTSASGVFGYASSSSNGVAGVSVLGNGMYARASGSGKGLWVESASGNAVFAQSNGPTTIHAVNTGNGYGVYGTTTGDSGVIGDNTQPVIDGRAAYGYNGLAGRSVVGYGVYGISTSSTGIFGTGNTGVTGVGVSTAVNAEGGSYGVTAVGSIAGVSSQSSDVGVRSYGGNFDFYATGPGVDYGTSSSIRWKENIVPIDNALDKVLSMRGVYFDWKKDHGGKHGMGMIAEEVGKVVPEVVSYEANGVDAIGMDYGHLTPVLIEAIKEQQKQIEAQQEEINLLKEEINVIKLSK